MENQKKSKGMTALVVLLLIVTIAALILATYAWAKYTSSGNGTAVANIAKWNVTFNETSDVVITTQTHVVTGKIAPGSKGTFAIQPNANDTEVCFTYEVKVTAVDLVDGSGNVVTTVGDNVSVAGFASHIVLREGSSSGTVMTVNSTALNGAYNLDGHNNATGATTDTTTIYWEWKYEDDPQTDAYDELDTAVGQAVASGEIAGLRFTYTVKATQVQPE